MWQKLSNLTKTTVKIKLHAMRYRYDFATRNTRMTSEANNAYAIDVDKNRWCETNVERKLNMRDDSQTLSTFRKNFNLGGQNWGMTAAPLYLDFTKKYELRETYFKVK